MADSKKKFFEHLRNNAYGIFPAPTDAQLALDTIAEYVLGEDWYSVNPINTEQINTEMVDEILRKVSRQYRKDLKEERRLMKREVSK